MMATTRKCMLTPICIVAAGMVLALAAGSRAQVAGDAPAAWSGPAAAAQPDPNMVAEATRRVLTIYEAPWDKKTPRERLTVGHRMYADAQNEPDAVVKYVMLRQALKLMAENGDVRCGPDTVDGITRIYAVDLFEEQLELLGRALGKFTKVAQPIAQEEWDRGARMCLRLLEENADGAGMLRSTADLQRLIAVSQALGSRCKQADTRQALSRALPRLYRQLVLGLNQKDWKNLAFLPGGGGSSGSNWAHTLQWWFLEGGKQLRVDLSEKREGSLLLLNANSPKAVCLREDLSLWLWDTKRKEFLGELAKHNKDAPITVVARDIGGGLAASGAADGAITLWDLENAKAVHRFMAHDPRLVRGSSGGVNSLVFSKDGRMILSGGGDHTVRLWDAITAEQRFSLTGHSGAVNTVALAADAGRALSGGADNAVCIWDLSLGSLIAQLSAHTKPVMTVAFSVDGDKALTSGADGAYYLWDLAQPQKPLASFKDDGDPVRMDVPVEGR